MSVQTHREPTVEAPAKEPAAAETTDHGSNADAISALKAAPPSDPGGDPSATPLTTQLALNGLGEQPAWAAPLEVAQAHADPAAAATEPAAEKKPFTQLGIDDQMAYMAKLMQDNRALLDANGLSAHLEQKMAAQVPREIGENNRRAAVGDDFLGQAGKLEKAMKGVDLTDPKQLEKLQAGLNEEQKHLLGRVQAGQLDLAALNGKDPAAKAAEREKLTQTGIDLRAQQYGEMEALRKKQEGGEKLDKSEAKRFAELKAKPAYMKGGQKMGEVWGLSQGRFADIYAKGNTRFEASHYRTQRDLYAKNLKKHDADAAAYAADPTRKAPSDTVGTESKIGHFDISPSGQKKMKDAGNYDLIGDICTSYGAGQIMGGYAQSEDWKGRYASERLQPIQLADGTEYTPSFAEVKAAGTRQNPSEQDLRIQMSLVKMGLRKKSEFDPDKKGLSNDTIDNDAYIRMYNGHTSKDPVYKQYDESLTTNGPIYEREKAKVQAETPAAPEKRTENPGLVQVADLDPSLLGASPQVTMNDASPSWATALAKTTPEKLEADPALKDVAPVEVAQNTDATRSIADPTKVDPANAKVDPATTPVAAAYQEKLDKEYTPLLKALSDATTDEQRQKAAQDVAAWNRANLVNQPDVQAFLARSDVSIEEKTKTMNALSLEIAKSEFLAGWANLGGVDSGNTWETDGKNKGAFPSEYLSSMKTPKLKSGANSPWCTSFVGYAEKMAGFQFDASAKGEAQSPFWSGIRLNKWATTGRNNSDKFQLNEPGHLVTDAATGGRFDAGLGTGLTSQLAAAKKDKAGNPIGTDAIASKFAADNGGFEPGDVLVTKPKGDGSSHTMMVDRYDPVTQTLYTIEGNAGDKVSSRAIDLKDPKGGAEKLGTRTRLGAEMFMTPETREKLAAKSVPGGPDAIDGAALLARARKTNGLLADTMGKKGWLGSTAADASVYDWAGNARLDANSSDR